ncbi:hypothetical protein Vi05172_g7704 [Venturia inaequalis]|nr:hypothetical protein Vi05172_g7704 [Venturia inaequalis]
MAVDEMSVAEVCVQEENEIQEECDPGGTGFNTAWERPSRKSKLPNP